MSERFFVVDGHSHLFRAFYAVHGLTAPDGRPSNAVFGFTAMLRKLISDQQPDYLAVAFDLPEPTFRHKLYRQYKATRQAAPEALTMQIPMTREVIEAMDIPVFTCAGYEADDVLGTLARLASEKGIDTCIVTSDKDARQLLGPHVSILDTRKDALTTADILRRQDGIAPEQVVDVMALAGDTSDNVPGVPGVGPKRALSLVCEYGGLEDVLRCVQAIKQPKLRASLIEFADQARLSKRLVTIDTHVPLAVDFERCRFRAPDPERLAPVYEKLNFRQFLDEFALPRTQEATEYHLVDTPKDLQRFVAQLGKQKCFSVDLETTSPAPRAAKIVGLSFAWQEREAFYLPVRAPLGEKHLDLADVLRALVPILGDKRVGKIGQNIKYDMVVLRNYDVRLSGVAFDTMIAAHLLDSERRRYSLAGLAADLLGYRMTPISDLIGKGGKQITMDRVPVRVVCDYACADADIALRLAGRLEKKLRERGLWELYNTVELPLVSVLAEMEYEGIGFDPTVLVEMSAWLGREIEKLTGKIHAEAGEEFNVASPKQLSAILFDKLGLPKGKRTKTGASTNSDVLEHLAIQHPLPGLVLEYRQLSKLKSTYADALPQMVLADTGRIHTSFHQTGTATGRLSSSDPNLQNIPVRTEIGERIRRAFVPSSPAHELLSADYSQIELRILAHLSGDEALRRAFHEDEDIHRFVAAQVHEVRPEEVTPEMRRAAKAVNFGIVYGQTAFGLSRTLRIPMSQAEAFITEYFRRYPGVAAFISETVAQAHANGYVTTLCGRRRPLPGLDDRNRNIRQFAERAAVNTVIQGTAADMIKVAMVRLHTRLLEAHTRACMVLQIHDELLFDLPREEEDWVRAVAVDEMVGALALAVPVKVNVAVGSNWMEAK